MEKHTKSYECLYETNEYTMKQSLGKLNHTYWTNCIYFIQSFIILAGLGLQKVNVLKVCTYMQHVWLMIRIISSILTTCMLCFNENKVKLQNIIEFTREGFRS